MPAQRPKTPNWLTMTEPQLRAYLGQLTRSLKAPGEPRAPSGTGHMRFVPGAKLTPAQISDLRKNDMFFRWLAGKHQIAGRPVMSRGIGVDPRTGRLVDRTEYAPQSPFGQVIRHPPPVPKAGWMTSWERQRTLPKSQRRPLPPRPPIPQAAWPDPY